MRRIVFSLVTMALTGGLAMCGGAFSLNDQPGDSGVGGGGSSSSEGFDDGSAPGDSSALDAADTSTGDHHSAPPESGPPIPDATSDGGGGGADSGFHDGGGTLDGSVHDAGGMSDGPILLDVIPLDVITCPPCGEGGIVANGQIVCAEVACPLGAAQSSN
jgi:hypothetical protein